MKHFGLVVAVMSMMVGGAATAADSAGTIDYRNSSSDGTETISIGPDRVMHFTREGDMEPKTVTATITKDEYKKLQTAAKSDAFMKLDNDYVVSGNWGHPGVDLSVTANGKKIDVAAEKAPEGLQPLIDQLTALEKKYVKTDAATVGPIQYHHSWMKGSIDITIGSDKVMHYKGGRVAKPTELTTKITDEEYAQLREAVESKDFAKLKNTYVNRDVRDGFSTIVSVNGKEVTVENAEPPAALQKLLDVINALQKKYVKDE